MPLTLPGQAKLNALYTERDMAYCRAVIAKAEAHDGELHPLCRVELLKRKTGLFSDQINAIVHEIEPSVFTREVNWDSRKIPVYAARLPSKPIAA